MPDRLIEIVETAIQANHASESICTLLDGRVIPVAPEPACVRALAEEIVDAIVSANQRSGSPPGETMTADAALTRIRRLSGVPDRPSPRRMLQPRRPLRRGWERWTAPS